MKCNNLMQTCLNQQKYLHREYFRRNQRPLVGRCPVSWFLFKVLFWSENAKKGQLNEGTLVSATPIYQTKCPFTVLSVPFLFFRTLPDDSRLFPVTRSKLKVFYKNIIHQRIIVFVQLFVAEIFAFYVFADVSISEKCLHHQKIFI